MSRGFSQAAVPSIRVPMKYSSGKLLEGAEVNSATVTDTDDVAPKGAQRIGVFITISAEDSSAATLDVDIEQSPDKGTTWVDMPISANSETGAALDQFTAVGSKFKWFEHCGDGQFTRVRAELDQGGLTSSTGITFGKCYWFFSHVD